MKIGNLMIIGDSYSTYENWIPRNYLFWYNDEWHSENGVNTVEKTWWHLLLQEPCTRLVMNDSYSGSTICNTRYDEYCPHYSFVGRVDRYIADGFFVNNRVDTLIVLGGTNDSWTGSPVGRVKYAHWNGDDLKEALPAFCYLLQRLQDHLPKAKIVTVVNTDEIKQELVEGYSQASNHYRIPCVLLREIDRVGGHPTAMGMAQIKSQILKQLECDCEHND